MNKYIWSLDISTTNIGYSLWNKKGELIEMKHISLNLKNDIDPEFRDLYKAELFEKYCEDYKKYVEEKYKGYISDIIVEAPLQNTPKNINTTALLLGFNGICRYILSKTFNVKPLKITVHDSRKLFCTEIVKKVKKKGKYEDVLSFPDKYKKEKKLYVWEKVAKLEPNINWLYTRNNTLKSICYDMSDSYACGYSGIIKFNLKED